jgi:CBS domain-containing protein
MRIDQLAVRAPVTVSPDTTLEQAARAMADHAVGCVIVTEGGRVVGILTDRDLVVRGVAERVPLDARVDSIMSMDVVAVDVSTDVRDVIRTFWHHAVRRLPVVTGAHVTGIVSLDDLLVSFTNQFAELTNGLTAQLLFPHGADEPHRPVPA